MPRRARLRRIRTNLSDLVEDRQSCLSSVARDGQTRLSVLHERRYSHALALRSCGAFDSHDPPDGGSARRSRALRGGGLVGHDAVRNSTPGFSFWAWSSSQSEVKRTTAWWSLSTARRER